MKYVMALAGWICVALGFIGMFLPLLPTTPFLLLASFLFFHSSPKARAWLFGHPVFGQILTDFQIHRAIPLKIKILSISLIWASIGYSVVFVVEAWWFRGLLLAIAVATSVHIASFRTRKRE